MKYATSWKSYFKLPNQGLRAYFHHVVSGQPQEYRTKFFEGKPLEEVLQGWSNTCDELSHSWPTLLDFENDLKAKVGPLSIMNPLKDRMEDIDSYYDSISSESSPIRKSAIDSVISEWGSKIGGLRLRGVQHTVDEMKKSTNSGSPYFTKRRNVVDDTLPVELLKDGFIRLHGNRWAYCAILGWRGQEGGPSDDDVKQRVVWMFPFAVNILELQFYQPLIAACQKWQLVPAWVGMDSVDVAMTHLFDTKRPQDLVIATDFTKFDQHFNRNLQNCARTIYASIANCADWLDNVFPIKFDIPLAYDWETIRFGEHGMASGSGGTNADETAAHRALQYEAAGSKLNIHSQCLGDDGILSYPGCTVDEVVDTYTKHGLDMNMDKQYSSTDDTVYLRRWHHKDYRIDNICVGVYSTYRALGRLCEQERYYDPKVWSKEMVALRQLSILENVKFHPLRDKFVDYCMEGDKYRLGLDIPGFFENLAHLTQRATDYMPDFLGYTKSQQKQTNINDWWIVKTLKSMR